MQIKYTHLLYSLLLTTITHHAFCMKSANKHPIITGVKKPTCVAFLHNNKVAIAGHDNFTLMDMRTKSVLCEDTMECNAIDMAVDKHRSHVALSRDGIITVYNAYTEEK